jgi:hypothetical protein
VTGVEVPTATGHYQDGPILGLRMKSGAWIGGSRLTTKRAIESYQATITEAGPVFVDLECSYRFAGEKSWVMKLRLIAGEPVVLIRETFNLDDGSRWDFLVSPSFSPNQVFRRIESFGPLEQYSVAPLTEQGKGAPLLLCPWVRWWNQPDAAFFGLFHAPEGVAFTRDETQQRLVAQGAPPPAAGEWDDMLIAAAGHLAAWVAPGDSAYSKFAPLQALPDGQLALQLQLASPGRSWLLGAGSVKESLVTDKEVAPVQLLRQRYLETSLDSVKDMPLHWRHTASYPRLVMNRDDVKRLVASPDFEKTLASNARWSGTYAAMKGLLMQRIAGQPGTATPAQLDDLKRNVVELKHSIRYAMSYFRYGNNTRSAAMWGTILPRLDVGFTLPWMDYALGADLFTPAEKERYLAQLAFLADKIASPDYLSPERGVVREANIETAWAASLVLMACMMPDHPHAQAWYQEGMSHLDYMLDHWQGPNGAWVEAPHYQVGAMVSILLAKIAAVKSGYLPDARDERLLRAVMFLAKLNTPPDARFANRRHVPPLGHTFLMETSMLFGAMAKLYRPKQPEQAAELQWVWQQQGKPHWFGVGGASMLDFYIELLAEEDWNPPAPAWASAAFPGFGAVLRSGFPGDRETYLVYHQGEIATQHYDEDQGSFEFWGKGRPLCLYWGFIGNEPAWHYNRMDIGDKGQVREFTTLPSADYLHGRQAEETDAWDRQLLFVKDRDPRGPTYVVLRDTTTGAGPANWWLWVNTRKDNPTPAVQVEGDVAHVAHVVGADDVDLDVWFAPPAHAPRNTLEVKDLTLTTITELLDGSWSSGSEGKTAQTGLHQVQPRGEPLVSLLYPRLRDEQPPVFTALAEGQGVKVENPQATDYAFLALAPFEFTAGPLHFRGTAGAVQVRGAQVTLTLSAAGEISYGTAKLISTTPISQTFPTF